MDSYHHLMKLNTANSSSTESLSDSASSTSALEIAISAQADAELRILLGPKPKRPLSSYNLFFRSERQKMITSLPTRVEGKPARSHGKCGFSDMAKIIAKKWNEEDFDLEEKVVFDRIAEKEKARYQHEMDIYRTRRTAIFGTAKKNTKSKSKAASKKANSTTNTKRAPLTNRCIAPERSAVPAITWSSQTAAPAVNDFSLHNLLTGSSTTLPPLRTPSPIVFSHLHNGIEDLASTLNSEDVDFLIHAFARPTQQQQSSNNSTY